MVNVRYWHLEDIGCCIANVRFQGLSGHCSGTAFCVWQISFATHHETHAEHDDHDRIENLASIWSKKRGRRKDWATSFREELCASSNLAPQRAGVHIIRHKKGPLAPAIRPPS